MQVTPLPLNPELQEHVKLPIVFEHAPLVSSQLSVFIPHSSTSEIGMNTTLLWLQPLHLEILGFDISVLFYGDTMKKLKFVPFL